MNTSYCERVITGLDAALNSQTIWCTYTQGRQIIFNPPSTVKCAVRVWMPKLPYSGRQTLRHHPLLLSHYPKALLHDPNDDAGAEVSSNKPQCIS